MLICKRTIEDIEDGDSSISCLYIIDVSAYHEDTNIKLENTFKLGKTNTYIKKRLKQYNYLVDVRNITYIQCTIPEKRERLIKAYLKHNKCEPVCGNEYFKCTRGYLEDILTHFALIEEQEILKIEDAYINNYNYCLSLFDIMDIHKKELTILELKNIVSTLIYENTLLKKSLIKKEKNEDNYILNNSVCKCKNPLILEVEYILKYFKTNDIYLLINKINNLTDYADIILKYYFVDKNKNLNIECIDRKGVFRYLNKDNNITYVEGEEIYNLFCQVYLNVKKYYIIDLNLNENENPSKHIITQTVTAKKKFIKYLIDNTYILNHRSA